VAVTRNSDRAVLGTLDGHDFGQSKSTMATLDQAYSSLRGDRVLASLT
jgi:hypothetical protein